MKASKVKKNSVMMVAAVLLLIAFMIPFHQSFSQTKKQLQNQRDELNGKIELTKKLIKESESQQKSTTSQVRILNEQLAYREQLLHNISSDIKHIDGEIEVKNQDITVLRTQVKSMKREYGKMIYNAYRNRSGYDKLMYIFSAENFYQAYKRFKMTQRYAEFRKRQAMVISGTQQEIEINVNLLEKNKTEKQRLAENKKKEKQQMAENKIAQQKKLEDLQNESASLREQQKKHKLDRDRLSAKIQEIIAEEIRKENDRKEAERKKANAANATASKTTTGSTAKTTKVMEFAPETVLVNADFEKNKGALPWPVSAGVITSRFGKHPHTSLEQVIVNNNGLDFTTEKNALALAIFSGTVSSVFNIPGAGQNVIVTHGSYKSVYSGLSDVNVNVGDKIDAKQKIGTVMFDGEEYTLHFEVWKIGSEAGSAQNPELWIKKRG